MSMRHLLLMAPTILFLISHAHASPASSSSSKTQTKRQNFASSAQNSKQSFERNRLESQVNALGLQIKAIDKALANRELPRAAFLRTIEFMSKNRKLVRNRRYVGLVDFSKSIATPRFFVVNLRTGAVGKFHVSHGKGSDPNRTGRPQSFSNINGSQMSSLGFYLTKNPYHGRFGYSMRLRGLSSTNSRAESRAIVLHPYYVGPGFEHIYARHMGRNCVNGGCLTEGCFGVSPKVVDHLVENFQGGAIIYAFK